MTSLLQEDVDWTPEARHEFLVTIDEETDRLNALVGNLLDMSRLQTGALDVSRARSGSTRSIPAALASIGARAADVEVDVPETLAAGASRPRAARARTRQRDRQRAPPQPAR